DLDAVTRLLGHVGDDAADGARAVTQRRGAAEHLDAVQPLDARVVVAGVADEQAGRDRRTVLENQRLVIRGAQAPDADVRDDGRLLLRLDRDAGDAPQRFLRRA